MPDPELPFGDEDGRPIETSTEPGGPPVPEVPDLRRTTGEPYATEARVPDGTVGTSGPGTSREEYSSRGSRGGSSTSRPRSSRTGRPPKQQIGADGDGRDLERRVGRVEFADGALVRLRAPVRVDAESGRDVLTDIDVLAIDVDGRLRISRSILECKSGSGQAKEPDRLLWLAGLQKFLQFDRAVLVRQSVSRRGRGLARALGLKVLDVSRLSNREVAHGWLPEMFAHIDGPECTAAESRTDTQLKGIGHIPPELVAYLRHDALRSDSPDTLRAIANLGRAAGRGGVLPSPTRQVLSAHALVAQLLAATADAARLDELSPQELQERTERALTTGSPDSNQMLNVLARADDLVTYMLQRVHGAYEESGAKRVHVDIPSLREVVTRPPEWVPHYLDLVQKLRAKPAVAREILQTAELACFEALLGGRAHLADAFDHLFTGEHRYLLHVAIRCLESIAGPAIADPVRPILNLDFDRMIAHSDRTLTEGSPQRKKAPISPDF